ncbi:hypothetical protein SY2F82_58090 [Streptomyces sp. Y2F8-2]|nr:hypothetical protein SY2F82_58090 [Streptomyces sp. Y2F8-2]
MGRPSRSGVAGAGRTKAGRGERLTILPPSATLTTLGKRIRRVVASTRTSTKWAIRLNAVKGPSEESPSPVQTSDITVGTTLSAKPSDITFGRRQRAEAVPTTAVTTAGSVCLRSPRSADACRWQSCCRSRRGTCRTAG